MPALARTHLSLEVGKPQSPDGIGLGGVGPSPGPHWASGRFPRSPAPPPRAWTPPCSAPVLWPGPACSFRFVIASRMLTECWQASSHTILNVQHRARGSSWHPAAHLLTAEPLAFRSELCLLLWVTQPQEGQRPFLPPKEEMGNFPLLSPESW